MNKNIVYVTLLLGLGGYFAYDTYYPEYVKWESEIEELQKKIDTAKQNAPKLADLRKDEQQLKSRLRASLAQLPSGAELTDLMVMVMPLLEECGISSSRITQKSVDNPQLQQVYRVHPIKISGIKDLSMQTIIEVMHKIREFKRIINAKSVRMQRTGPDRYTLDMDLETYSYIETEGEDLGLEEEPVPEETPATPAAETTPAETESSGETQAAAPVTTEDTQTADAENATETEQAGAPSDTGATAEGAR